MFWRFLSLIILSLLLFSACSADKEKDTSSSSGSPEKAALVSKVEIQPASATRESTFYISSKEIDLTKVKMQWYVNGKPVQGAMAAQFKPAEIKKGDSVQVRVFTGELEAVSNQVTAGNIKPEIIRAKIIPELPRSNDTLKADILANDRDGEKVSFVYAWLRNAKPSGTLSSFTGPFKRDESISVTITPFDGTDYGTPVTLTTKIGNSPPVSASKEAEKFAGSTYTCTVKAADPDGDVLTFVLKQSPKGMVIDKGSGIITWITTEKDVGTHPVVVEINDGHDGKAEFRYAVTVSFRKGG
jgi:hypothetical protein